MQTVASLRGRGRGRGSGAWGGEGEGGRVGIPGEGGKSRAWLEAGDQSVGNAQRPGVGHRRSQSSRALSGPRVGLGLGLGVTRGVGGGGGGGGDGDGIGGEYQFGRADARQAESVINRDRVGAREHGAASPPAERGRVRKFVERSERREDILLHESKRAAPRSPSYWRQRAAGSGALHDGASRLTRGLER